MYFFCPSWGPQTAEQRSNLNILRALAGYTPDYSEATTLNRKSWWMSAHNFPAYSIAAAWLVKAKMHPALVCIKDARITDQNPILR
jgi:hypothetical protein